jgi:hypothetical protein
VGGDTVVYVDNSVDMVDIKCESDRKYDIFRFYPQKSTFAIPLAK